HAAAGGPITIMRFLEPDLPDIVYLEQLTSALYLDKRDDVDHYLAVMDRLSAQAESPRGTQAILEELIGGSEEE
ncbi:Scr1 family TA system antitoxin-like transcriptional regulator, partial [Streptomyces chrestomyceticus]